MEVVEIVVFLTITIIIGGMVILFVADIDEEGIYSSFSQMLYGGESTSYEQANEERFARAAFQTWRECGQGAQEQELVITYAGEEDMDEAKMFEYIRKFNLCYTLQSGHNNCGTRQDTEFSETITPGSTVILRCNADEEVLQISSI